MFSFGAGTIWATPLQDAFGNTITNPTPVQLGVSQDATLNVKFDLKELHGEKQFAVAVARGKGSVDFKVKSALMNAVAFNSVVFGQTLTAGLRTNYYDVAGTSLASTSVTITPPSSGTYVADLGVRDGNGRPYTKVASAPAVGQYAVNTGTGVYTFAAGDSGKVVFISYSYTVASANAPTAQTSSVLNLPMGQQPLMQIDYWSKFEGKDIAFTLPKAANAGFNMGTKQDDFAVPEIEFKALADANNVVMRWSMAE